MDDSTASLKKSQEAAGVQDILGCICYHLQHAIDASPPDRSQARMTLLRAALSFKTMREPALDALWHTIPSITPLLRLLPFVSYQVNSEYSFASGEVDWTRLNHHAIRVRAVVLENDPRNRTISPVLLSYLNKIRRTHLLPGIVTLHIPPGVTFNHMSIFPMISPSLKVLKISTQSKTELSIALLHVVKDVCPQLLQLEITDGNSFIIAAPILQIKLQRLHLHTPGATLPSSFLTNTLDSYGTLEHLQISARDVQTEGRGNRNSNRLANPLPQDSRRTLVNLTTLELRGDMPSFLTWASARARSLTHLSISLDSCSALESPRPLCHLTNLKSLQIHTATPYSSSRRGFDLSALIAAEFSRTLEHLTFATDTSVSTMTNSVVELLATSLPNLKTLCFPLNVDGGVYPTTDGLISLATRCQDLRTLHIPLQSILAPSNNPTSHSHLNHLLIYTGRDPGPPLLSSTIALARVFHRHFPELKTFETYGHCSTNTKETCSSIKELLHFLRDVAI